MARVPQTRTVYVSSPRYQGHATVTTPGRYRVATLARITRTS